MLAAAVGTSAAAADGTLITGYAKGDTVVMEYLLCDGNHSATDCDEFDLYGSDLGVPSQVVIDVQKETGCVGIPVVKPRGLDQPLGVPYLYASMSSGGVSSLVVPPTRHRHIDAVPLAVGCTDLEVVLRLFYYQANHQTFQFFLNIFPR